MRSLNHHLPEDWEPPSGGKWTSTDDPVGEEVEFHEELRDEGQEAMAGETKLHRHFVAAPIVVAFFVLSAVLLGRTTMLGRVTTPTPARISHAVGTSFLLPGGVAALVRGQADAVIDAVSGTPSLASGDLLLSANGLLRLTAGQWTVRGLPGTFFVSFAPTGLTVAALSAPLLLTDAAGERVLVPAGYQWKQGETSLPAPADPAAWIGSRAVHALPSSFLANERRLASGLTVPSVGPGPYADTPSYLIRPFGGPATADDRTQLLGHVRFLTETGDLLALHGFLSDPAVSSVLRDGDDRDALYVSLMAGAGDRRGAVLELLPPLVRKNTDLWLLASVHPLFQPEAWIVPPPRAQRDTLLLRLMLFPLADNGEKAFPAASVERWQAAVAALLADDGQAAAWTDALLAETKPLFAYFRDNGYVERTQRWTESVRAVAAPVKDLLSEGGKAFLGALEHPQISAAASSGVASSVSSLPPLPPDEIRVRTTEDLKGVGALLTIQTAIEPREDGKATVRDVIFPGSNENILFGFTYDPVSKQVSDIDKGGLTFPYSLTIDRFAAWARGD